MNAVLERLRAIAEVSGGYLMTRQAEEAGISRGRLKQYVDSGELIQVCKGRYILPDTAMDEYALIQSRSRRAIFSYGTALFFWGLSDRVPHVFDMTVLQGTNVTRIRRDHPDVRFHYVQADLHPLGQTETRSPHGNSILLYDKERCICDMIRSRKQADMQLYTQAIKDYFAHHPNIRKLLKYGKQFGIEDKIRTYTEVLL